LSKPEPQELVHISPISVPPAPPPSNSGWDHLSPEDRQIHLRAQRFARVQVAEMRLYHSDAVQAGRTRGNLYEVPP